MSEIPAAAVEAAARILASRAGWEHPGPWAGFKHRKFYDAEARNLLAAAARLIRQATADDIAAEIEADVETFFAGRVEAGMWEAAFRAAFIARRVGGGGGGGQ
jgi:hypothetical protein